MIFTKDKLYEDPDWFNTVRMTKTKSKKQVLRDNAKRRIKSYYYKVRQQKRQDSEVVAKVSILWFRV